MAMKTHRTSLVGIVVVFSALHLSAQPKLEVREGTSLDFGTIYRGAQIERPVTLRNTGTDTLILGNIEASCGCTAAVVSNKRVPPGKSVALLITFNSKNFSGAVHKTVTVNSNTPDSPRLAIEFTANIIDEIVLTPQNFWFRDAQVGKPNTFTIVLRNGGKDTLELSAFTTTFSDFSLNLPSGPINPGATYQLIATFTPKAAIPVIADHVFLVTTNPRQPTVAVPIYGNAKP
jgi:hypothetical protein